MDFVRSVFDDGFLQLPELDLGLVVEKESSSISPLLLCSTPGHDASYLVDDLASRTKKPYKALAIGSAEGFDLAEKAIQAAAKAGR
jgi:dynein heavy chain 1